MARPRATSSRTNSGVTWSGMRGAEILAVALRRVRAAWARPRFSRMATYSISGVTMPARA